MNLKAATLSGMSKMQIGRETNYANKRQQNGV